MYRKQNVARAATHHTLRIFFPLFLKAHINPLSATFKEGHPLISLALNVQVITECVDVTHKCSSYFPTDQLFCYSRS